MKKLLLYLSLFLVAYITFSYNFKYFNGVSKNAQDGRFFNSFEESKPILDSKTKTGGKSVNKWLLNRNKTKVEWTEDDIKKFAKFDIYTKKDYSKGLEIIFINHASFLIQIEGVNIITDPIWSERSSPVSFFGPKRFINPPFKITELPKIDYVLISHSHFDHLDLPTLKTLKTLFNPVFIGGLGTCKFLLRNGIKNCIQKDWGEKVEVKKNFNIFFEKAKHWSKRSLFDTNKILWGSFVIASNKYKVYFAGDTGYGKHFQIIGDEYNGFDVALLPIGAYKPQYIMKYSHINPYEAALAHKDLKAKLSLGMHLKTFQLTDEGFNDPIIKLKVAKNNLNLKKQEFKVLNFGERYIL
jgi:L-ascorbate metabolism protein UlaG (beta-lactamase superfamily)